MHIHASLSRCPWPRDSEPEIIHSIFSCFLPPFVHRVKRFSARMILSFDGIKKILKNFKNQVLNFWIFFGLLGLDSLALERFMIRFRDLRINFFYTKSFYVTCNVWAKKRSSYFIPFHNIQNGKIKNLVNTD